MSSPRKKDVMPGDDIAGRPLCCLWCDELIDAAEDLAMITNGEFHHACLTRILFGSVGHLLKQCRCFGGLSEDPPGMTRRQAATAASELLDQLEQGAAQSAYIRKPLGVPHAG